MVKQLFLFEMSPNTTRPYVGPAVRLLGVCRIVIFAESEYSAEHSALPNNEENMFNQASVQCRCSFKRVTLYQYFVIYTMYIYVQ